MQGFQEVEVIIKTHSSAGILQQTCLIEKEQQVHEVEPRPKSVLAAVAPPKAVRSDELV